MRRGPRWLTRLVWLAMGAAAAVGCARKGTKEDQPPPITATATLEGRSGSGLTGTATFKQRPNESRTQLEVVVQNVPPGKRGVHIHEVGDCSDPQAESAGEHFDPEGNPHGSPDAPPHHAGDLGNISVGGDGSGRLERTVSALTVVEGPHSVQGKAIIVHADPDDFTTQPSGNAGARIGCGVIQLAQPGGM